MKTARHDMILDLIEKEVIETQDDLAEALRKRNFKVTQATISRDIKELRLVKVLTDDGRYKYAVADKASSGLIDRFIKIFSQSVLSIEYNESIIVIKTLSGSANVAAEAIDVFKWPEVLGTLAGDNTIFVTCRKASDVPIVAKKFVDMIW